MLLTLIIMLTGLVLAGLMRSVGGDWVGMATPLYIAVTVFAIIRLRSSGCLPPGLGFGLPFKPVYLVWAIAGVILIKLYAVLIDPTITAWLGDRTLTRFSTVTAGDLGDLLTFLLLSWTMAAIGEEVCYRIVLMTALKTILSHSYGAIILQALLFGLAHLYQGPAAVLSASFSGLIYGVLVHRSGGAIWPAFLAHGLNNSLSLWQLYGA